MNQEQKEYVAYVRDECSDWPEPIDITASSAEEALQEAWRAVECGIVDGDYGQDEAGGARVRVWIEIADADGDVVAEDVAWIDIEPDHEAAIAAAGGDPTCDHVWTSEGEGGCDENPGVWSVGGTAMLFRSHCRRCGLRREEYHTGPQFNPGDHDSVRYSMPEEKEDNSEAAEKQ